MVENDNESAESVALAMVEHLNDGDMTFNLDTIEVDGKWYVYDESFCDKGFAIRVPKDATIKINGNKVDSENYKYVLQTNDLVYNFYTETKKDNIYY